MKQSSFPTPAEPTPEQCSERDRVPIGDTDIVAHAVWWPQQGGRVGKAVITIGDCSELWLWHDGDQPTNGQPPRQIHLDDYGQWVDLFEWLTEQRELLHHGSHLPYVLNLPPGVTRQEAEEVHAKVLEWGMWDPDPGGFVIRTHEEQLAARRPCIPVPCPPFPEPEPPIVDEASASPTPWSDTIRDNMPLMYEIPPGTRLHEQTLKYLTSAAPGGVRWVDEHTVLAPDAKIRATQPVLKWIESYETQYHPGDSPFIDSLLGQVSLGFRMFETPPAVDVRLMLEQDARRLATPTFPPRSYPHVDHDVPLFVGLVDGVSAEQATAAIALCQRLGLVAETPAGVVLFPPGMDFPVGGEPT